MQFQRNQFAFHNGASATSAANASAVYLFTSRLNHACCPNVVLKPKVALAAAQPPKPGEPLGGGAGRVAATAAVAVAPGAALTINYGPVQLLTWPLPQRRAYLVAKHGFWCGCPRCAAEEAAAAAASASSDAGDASYEGCHATAAATTAAASAASSSSITAPAAPALPGASKPTGASKELRTPAPLAVPDAFPGASLFEASLTPAADEADGMAGGSGGGASEGDSWVSGLEAALSADGKGKASGGGGKKKGKKGKKG
jgi:hypothetical protein